MQELLVPDTTRVKNATKFVTQCLKNAESVKVLLKIVQCHQNAALRQMSAVFIRKKINSYWKQMNETMRNQAKALLLTRLRQDPSKTDHEERSPERSRRLESFKYRTEENVMISYNTRLQQVRVKMQWTERCRCCCFIFLPVKSRILSRNTLINLNLFVRLMKDNESAVRIMALKATAQVLEHVSDGAWYRILRCDSDDVEIRKFRSKERRGRCSSPLAFDLMCTLSEADGLLLLNPYITPVMQLILETASQDDCVAETRNSALMVFAALRNPSLVRCRSIRTFNKPFNFL